MSQDWKPFPLDCGDDVRVLAFHCWNFYFTIWTKPSPGGAMIFAAKGIEDRMKNTWPGRKFVVLPFERENDRSMPPSWIVHVSLSCDTFKRDETADWSQLVVVFFTHTISDKPLMAIIREAVAPVDWRAHAEDVWL